MEAYIGVLIDDLVTKGTQEPYRMFTSRAEYRLLLRQDNADQRLMGKGHKLGLVSGELHERCLEKQAAVAEEINRLESAKVVPDKFHLPLLSRLGIEEMKSPTTLSGLLRRPEITYGRLIEVYNGASVPALVGEQVEIEVKYAAFIERQNQMVARQKKLENYNIPHDFEYKDIPGLSREAAQRLEEVRPVTLGQASRISGLTPSAITILLLLLERRSKQTAGH